MRKTNPLVFVLCLGAVSVGCDSTPLAVEDGVEAPLMVTSSDPSDRLIPDDAIRLNLSEACFTVDFGPFPANTPFYVQHGWRFPDWTEGGRSSSTARRQALSPNTSFVLRVDGEVVDSRMIFELMPDGALEKTFLSVFEKGLEGRHHFAGTWTHEGLGDVLTCAAWIDFT